MRRAIVLFMLLLVQFQFVWAGAASYCAHETGIAAVASHFGHHEHRHNGAASDAPAAEQENNGLGLPHPDCESCHLGTAGILLPMPAFLAPAVQGEYLPALSPIFISHVSSTPERPDRITRDAAA
ncbi:MAG: cation efflux protein, CzcI family [Pseudomonadota bacterium]